MAKTQIGSQNSLKSGGLSAAIVALVLLSAASAHAALSSRLRERIP